MYRRCLPVMAVMMLALTACMRQPVPVSYAAAPGHRPIRAPEVLQYRGERVSRVVTPPVVVTKVSPAVRAAVRSSAKSSAKKPIASEPPYTLDAGDRLRITVFGQEGLSNIYAVDASGHVAMPLIGSVPAHGLTPQQLAKEIAERLRHGFVRDPSVSAEIVTYRPFFILGEVNNPGQYPYVAHMSVETAVAIAGGFAPRAYKDRVSVSRPVNGATVSLNVPPNFEVKPGDTIKVNERWF